MEDWGTLQGRSLWLGLPAQVSFTGRIPVPGVSTFSLGQTKLGHYRFLLRRTEEATYPVLERVLFVWPTLRAGRVELGLGITRAAPSLGVQLCEACTLAT